MRKHLHQQLQAKEIPKHGARQHGESVFLINASQDYRVDTVTTVINQSDILGAIDELKPDFRKPFTMFLDGYHYDEIAEMNIPMGTVKSRIFHARKTCHRHWPISN